MAKSKKRIAKAPVKKKLSASEQRYWADILAEIDRNIDALYDVKEKILAQFEVTGFGEASLGI